MNKNKLLTIYSSIFRGAFNRFVVCQHPRNFIRFGDNFNSKNSKKLITVNEKICNRDCKILIDTEIPLINKTIIHELKLNRITFKMPKITLVGANDKKLCEVNKGIVIQTTFLEKEYPINLVIIDNMNYDMVMRNYEFRLGIIIDFLNGQIQIGDEIIEFKCSTLNNEARNDIKVNEMGKYMYDINKNGILMKNIENEGMEMGNMNVYKT